MGRNIDGLEAHDASRAFAWVAGPCEHFAVSDCKAGVVLQDAILARMLGMSHLQQMSNQNVHPGCIYTQMQSIHIFWRTTYLQVWL